MTSVIKNSIEYSGLSIDISGLIYPYCFKQLNVHKVFNIQDAKPEISQIVKVTANIGLSGSKLINMNEGVSEEGQIISGKSLIVEGELSHELEYSTDAPSQNFYFASFKSYFSSYIILPKDFKAGSPVSVAGYIEDMSYSQLNKRDVFAFTSILLVAEF